MISVEITTQLRQSLCNNNADPQKLINRFREWKMAGENGEDDFYEFGKDTAYITPKVNGKNYVLRHTHLVPLLDKIQSDKWNKNWQNHRLRTSDRALVYVQDNHRFLLIDILPEPFAHKISQMKTPQDKQLMEIFAKIAEHFIYCQEIIN
ncbi:MAG: type II toxin-antitoxin system YafO family toxin [Neisseriaceae bacterium]|nr:type II toxin-antitoxin system YafO family toxin [Neisseriaceae bacterium]